MLALTFCNTSEPVPPTFIAPTKTTDAAARAVRCGPPVPELYSTIPCSA